MTHRAAVIGAGPSGFYATEQLLKAGFEVDLYEVLPTPFGLVRAGVAPDHPKIKSVTRVYEKTARHPGFRFFGGVELGADISRDELLERYHAVVYAVGTATDNRLGIAGEDRPGSHSATEFVAWYNGHPDFADHEFDLSATRAVVIGNGNVAVDVARMLVLDPDEVALTDTADHAVEALASASVHDVVVLGRRGPVQAAFTTPELRELGELTRADIAIEPGALELDEAGAAFLESDECGSTTKRNVEVLRDYAQRAPSGRERRVELRFLWSPVEILGEGDDGPVTGVRVVRNRLENGRAVPTGEEAVIACGLVLRSIGYRGMPLAGIPFDDRRGLIRNEGGRVVGDDGERQRGEYAVGWVKRGPSGVIGTNKKDAADTVAKILEDEQAGALNEPTATPEQDWLAERVPGLVDWQGWRAIDAHETAAGEPHGRPRVKLVRVPHMLDAARASTLS
jgi:ferredoxin--NADP+ reductase